MQIQDGTGTTQRSIKKSTHAPLSYIWVQSSAPNVEYTNAACIPDISSFTWQIDTKLVTHATQLPPLPFTVTYDSDTISSPPSKIVVGSRNLIADQGVYSGFKYKLAGTPVIPSDPETYELGTFEIEFVCTILNTACPSDLTYTAVTSPTAALREFTYDALQLTACNQRAIYSQLPLSPSLATLITDANPPSNNG